MIHLTESQVHDFQQHPVWLEMLSRIRKVQTAAEVAIEDSDVFIHGQAVGTRKVAATIAGLPEQFLHEIKSNGKAASIRP